MTILTADLPSRSRPAFVSWIDDGRPQQFPHDPVLERARHQQLKSAGLIKVRRIPASQVS